MHLQLPGIGVLTSVLSWARDGAGAVTAAATGAAQLVPRSVDLADRLSALLSRVEPLPARVEGLLESLDSLLDGVELLLVRVETLVDQVSETAQDASRIVTQSAVVAGSAEELVGTAGLVTTKADRVVEGGSGLLNRTDHLLSGASPVIESVLPLARRLVDSLEPVEVEAAVALLDRLPVVLAHLDDDVLPLLLTLDRVGPDVHEILSVVDDLRDMLAGLPGVGLLKKLGDRKDLDG